MTDFPKPGEMAPVGTLHPGAERLEDAKVRSNSERRQSSVNRGPVINQALSHQKSWSGVTVTRITP
jgi:hypothetical protein